MKKRINTNPRRGAKHFKAPSRIFWKGIRGMLPHKSPKGAAALNKLKVFEGVPFPYDMQKRMVIPEALKTLRLKSHRKFCSLSDLAAETGWTKGGVVADLEEKRKVKSGKYFELKQKKDAARAKAAGDKTVAKFTSELAKFGF